MEQFYLYIAIILSAIIIMMLSIAVVYYRRKLNKCKTALVRCINENIEMREKLPEYELPHFIGRDDITPEEFTNIIHNILKRLLYVFTFCHILYIQHNIMLIIRVKAHLLLIVGNKIVTKKTKKSLCGGLHVQR